MTKIVLSLVGGILACGIALCFVPGLAATGWVPLGMAAALSAVALWGLFHVRSLGRDEQYANLTPGDIPYYDGPAVQIKREEVTDAHVRFTPPRGVPPRLVGAIVREGSAPADIVATIISMAVRGYIHISRAPGQSPNERGRGEILFSAANANLRHLDRFETIVHQQLFSSGPYFRVTDPNFQDHLKVLCEHADREFQSQKWYREHPATAVSNTRKGGTLIALLGTVGALILGAVLNGHGWPGFAWLAVPSLVLGIGLIIIAKAMPVRTAAGAALAIQAYGFKKYLETAEAAQIRWEEGQDIFSEYLPYAISFGCAKRWVEVFGQMAAAGYPLPAWYADVGGTVVDVVEVVGGVIEILGAFGELVEGIGAVAEILGGVGEVVGGIAEVLGGLG